MAFTHIQKKSITLSLVAINLLAFLPSTREGSSGGGDGTSIGLTVYLLDLYC